MAIYTQNQLDRLADKVRGGGALGKEDALNLIRDCAKLRVELIDARESFAFLRAAIEAGVLIDDTAQGRQAKASLGVQTVPQAPVPLRWVEQDDGGAKLVLGDVSIAEVYTPIDDADAVWYPESEHRIAPRHADFPDRTAAMRAVEAAFGITNPLPVEGE